MINPVSNVSFKAIYTPKFVKLSESQQKVYDDIKTKLDKEMKESDFYIKPSKDDSIELSEVFGIKETGYGLNKKYSYKRRNVIGRYDENHPFEIKDYKDYCRKETKDFFAQILIGLMPVAAILGFMYVTGNKKPAETQQIEKVITVAKDSLQTLKQDTLQLTKDSLRMFK